MMTRSQKIWATRRKRNKVKPWNKGLTASTDSRMRSVGESVSAALKNREFTPEWKAKLSKKAKGKVISEETKKKMSKAHTGLKRLTPLSDTSREKMSRSHKRNRKRGIYKDTSIELKTEQALKELDLQYVKQHEVPSVVLVDFYLPAHNLVIECDGCYYHSCPTHYPDSFPKKVGVDFVRTRLMREMGYRVLRIWEHDINALTVKQLSVFISNKL